MKQQVFATYQAPLPIGGRATEARLVRKALPSAACVFDDVLTARAANATGSRPYRGVTFPFGGTSSTTRTVPRQPVSYLSPDRVQSSSSAVHELRRLSGLTWEQMAHVLLVSRRSVHLWASGGRLKSHNESHLLQTLSVMRDCDRGSAGSNRMLLMAPHEGTTPLELLAAQRYDKARAALGETKLGGRPTLAALDAQARAEREPQHPAELLGALTSRVPVETGRIRPVRPVRISRREHG